LLATRQARRAPAGEHGRECRDVCLGVAAVDAQGVQFEHLTREVFVQAGDARHDAVVALLPRQASHDARVRPGGERVVEVAQHRCMLSRRHQQLIEVAGDVGPDRFAFERADQPARCALGHRHREVIGPEQRQPFAERTLRGGSGAETRTQVGLHQFAKVIGELLFERFAWRRTIGWRVLADDAGRRHDCAGHRPQWAMHRRAADRPRRLREQPALRIAADHRQIGRRVRSGEPRARRGSTTTWRWVSARRAPRVCAIPEVREKLRKANAWAESLRAPAMR
jgi:hypothetical protein